MGCDYVCVASFLPSDTFLPECKHPLSAATPSCGRYAALHGVIHVASLRDFLNEQLTMNNEQYSPEQRYCLLPLPTAAFRSPFPPFSDKNKTAHLCGRAAFPKPVRLGRTAYVIRYLFASKSQWDGGFQRIVPYGYAHLAKRRTASCICGFQEITACFTYV